MLVMASEDSSLGPTVSFRHPVREQRQPARAATALFVFSENSSRLLIGNHTPDSARVDIYAKVKDAVEKLVFLSRSQFLTQQAGFKKNALRVRQKS
jgi:hypothetical protein